MTDDTYREAAGSKLRQPQDLHAVWAAAEAACAQALHCWFQAEPGGRGVAYHAYRAALDREAAAALDLQRRCERAARLVTAPAGPHPSMP
jgi:hypothetical protein